MIDREYVKLNTSIQTASNADHLLTDDQGNVEAVIELRLPDNLFSRRNGNKTVDKVKMQTSKLRLSMEKTPFAAIPIDTDLSKGDDVISTCQLDVYPFSILDDNVIQPNPNVYDSVFPYYKTHSVVYTIYGWDYSDESNPEQTTLQQIPVVANNPLTSYPSSDPFYEIMKKVGAFDNVDHIMNMTIPSNHEQLEQRNSTCYIKSIGTLAHMFQDAIENAMTYASTSDISFYDIHFVDSAHIPSDLDPQPNSELVVNINNINYVYWKSGPSDDPASHQRITNHLKFGVKPFVQLGGDTFSISYDSAAFDTQIPILWNPSYVDTFEHAGQLTLDKLRNSVWNQPPPKRVYKYGVNYDSTNYNFSLLDDITCGVCNIIGNKATAETFSFLPWTKVDFNKLRYMKQGEYLLEDVDVDIAEKEKFTTISYEPAQEGNEHQPTGKQYSYSPTSRLNGTYSLRYVFDFPVSETNGNTPSILNWETLCPQHLRENQNLNYLGETADIYPVKLTQKYSLDTIKTYEPPQTTATRINSTTIVDGDYQVGITVNSSSTPETSTSETETTIISANTSCRLWRSYDPTTSSLGLWALCYPPSGTWDPSLDSNPQYKWLPSSYVDHFSISNQTIDNIPYYRIQVQWYINPSEYQFQWFDLNDQTDNTRIREISEEYTTTTSYTLNETVIELAQPMTTTNVYPNLTLDDGCFYLLDGGTSQLQIGNQEVVQTNNLSPPPIPPTPVTRTAYKTTTTITTYRQRALYTANQNGCELAQKPSEITYLYTGVPDDQLESHPERYYPTPKPSVYEGKPVYTIVKMDVGGGEYDYSIYDVEHPQGTTTYLPIMINSMKQTTEFTNTTEPEINETVVISYDTSLTPGITETTTYNYEAVAPTGMYTYLDTASSRRFENYIGNTMNVVDLGVPGHTIMAPGVTPHYTYQVSPESSMQFQTWYLDDAPYNYKETFYPKYDVVYQQYRTVTTTQVKTVAILFNDTSMVTQQNQSSIQDDPEPNEYVGNVRLTFTWNNVPMVVMSPIASIVLTIDGVQLNQEIQPINIEEKAGSSLTATVPVIENFYSTATTLRDLHDELVVVKETFEDTATYNLSVTSGQERTITLKAKYIDKQGNLHQIYIPPNGVFSLQLIFGVSFYMM